MGLLKTAAKVGVASAVHGRVQRRQQQRWAAQDQAAAAAAMPPPPPAAVHHAPPPAAAAAPTTAAPGSAGPADVAQQFELLRQLGELRAAGLLNDTEFERKKAEILGFAGP